MDIDKDQFGKAFDRAVKETPVEYDTEPKKRGRGRPRKNQFAGIVHRSSKKGYWTWVHNAVSDSKELNWRDKEVYRVLAKYENHDESSPLYMVSYPSNKTICKEAGISMSSLYDHWEATLGRYVEGSLPRLVRLGFVIITKGRAKWNRICNLYHLLQHPSFVVKKEDDDEEILEP